MFQGPPAVLLGRLGLRSIPSAIFVALVDQEFPRLDVNVIPEKRGDGVTGVPWPVYLAAALGLLAALLVAGRRP